MLQLLFVFSSCLPAMPKRPGFCHSFLNILLEIVYFDDFYDKNLSKSVTVSHGGGRLLLRPPATAAETVAIAAHQGCSYDEAAAGGRHIHIVLENGRRDHCEDACSRQPPSSLQGQNHKDRDSGREIAIVVFVCLNAIIQK